jgi:hypothetical protein
MIHIGSKHTRYEYKRDATVKYLDYFRVVKESK